MGEGDAGWDLWISGRCGTGELSRVDVDVESARVRLLAAKALSESDFWCFFDRRHFPGPGDFASPKAAVFSGEAKVSCESRPLSVLDESDFLDALDRELLKLLQKESSPFVSLVVGER